MTALYSNIDTGDLRWLDRLKGKTGASLSASDETAPEGWLPEEVASRLESGKTYVMSINDEVLAITAPDQLERGLEGTNTADHEADSDLYQALTAHQLQWMIQRIAESESEDENGGGFNDPENPNLKTYSLTVGNPGGGDMYGFDSGAAGDKVGDMSPSSSDDLGEFYAIMWDTKGAYTSFLLGCENYHKNGLQLVFDDKSYIAKQVSKVFWISGYMYEVRIAHRKYAELEGDITPAGLDALPKSGTIDVKIGPSLWEGYPGSNAEDEFSFKLWVGEQQTPGHFYGYNRDTTYIGYMEPEYFPGHPAIKTLRWTTASQIFLEFEQSSVPSGFVFPEEIEVTVDGISGVFSQSWGRPEEYSLVPINQESPGRELYESLPTNNLTEGEELLVTIRYIRD